MERFILKRLFETILVVIMAVLASFVLLRYVGDPVNNMLGQAATIEQRETMRRALGLEDPVFAQFLGFVAQVLSGNLGVSYRFSVPVARLLLERLPATLELSVCAMLMATLLGVPLGVWTALHRRTVMSELACR